MYTATQMFLASLPLLWVAVKQRRVFHSTVLTALGFLVIQLVGINATESMLPILSIVPWSAVIVISFFEMPPVYTVLGVASIIATGILGLAISCYLFKKQDQ